MGPAPLIPHLSPVVGEGSALPESSPRASSSDLVGSYLAALPARLDARKGELKDLLAAPSGQDRLFILEDTIDEMATGVHETVEPICSKRVEEVSLAVAVHDQRRNIEELGRAAGD